MTEKRAVVAIGGNALILDGQRGTIAEQYDNAIEMARHIATLVAGGWGIVLTHGNGPQVGFILLRSELIGDSAPVPHLSLEMSSADSQGGIGHILAMALLNELAARGLPDKVAYVLTHTVVDADDPAFSQPTKPIGPFYTAGQAEDSGRGYRRVVPSPRPLRIVETAQIRTLVDAGFVVVAVGGGGIPVIETKRGYEGVEAVIDKDRASALLGVSLGVRFRAEFIRSAPRWLGSVALGTVGMIALCAAFGALLALGTGARVHGRHLRTTRIGHESARFVDTGGGAFATTSGR